MLGSANAPEPGFHPGALGSWHASGVLACAGGLWHALGGSGMRWWGLARSGAWRALGILARWGSGMRWGFWYAGGSGACCGLWRAWGGVGFPWRLTLSRLCLGWCCGLRVVAGLPVCGAVRGGERHVLLRSYVVGVHWVRAYACVALGEWRTDAASEEVYVGAGGGIASVAR